MGKNEFKNRESLFWMAGKTCNTFLNVFRNRFRSDMWGDSPVPNNVENFTKGLYMSIGMIVEKGCGWTYHKPSTNAERNSVVGEIMKGLLALLVKYPFSIGEFGINMAGFDPDDPLEKLLSVEQKMSEQEKHEMWEQDEQDEWEEEKESEEEKRINKQSPKERLKELNAKIRKAEAKEDKLHKKQAVTFLPLSEE